ncbi:MAG: hypothetical protein ABFD54_16030 [Armatimonadota bacterium]|nr:hypothetical protein [bacterium]
MGDITQQQAHQVWLQAQEKVKDRVIAPTLYVALELGVGITLEGDQFILGFKGADTPMAGHLRSAQHQAIIEQSISEIIHKKVRLKIVEGTTIEEYENHKKLASAREATQVTISQQRAHDRSVEQSWEEVAEKITRGYAKVQQRQFAQNRAAFIKWGYTVINEAVKKHNYTDKSEDVHKRALARVFEKFSTCVDVPSTMLAYEFMKLREEGKLT